jgi:hypothetical protein
VILLGVVLLCTAWTVARTDVAPDGVSMAVLGIGGLLTGLALAKLSTPDLLAHLFAEALQPPDRLEPDLNVQLVREQRADTAGAVARRAAGHRVALQQDRPWAPELGEVTQRRRPHHASPDHDHVRALVHVLMIADV